MAYNNYFPTNYQPYYPQQPQYQQQNTQGNGGIIWVQGEAGAKSYLVAPNTTVQLWDSENQVIYLKSADASGMPSMRIIDYTVRDMPQPNKQAQTADFATKNDLDALESKINAKFAEILQKEGIKDV